MNKQQFLQQTALFADVPERDLESIAQEFMPRRFAQREIIFRQGDLGQTLYLIWSGQVRIFVNGSDGSETSLILFGRPGDIFGELAVVDGLPRSATAVALDDTVLLITGREQFAAHMRRCPQLALNFMKELSRRMRHNTRHMDSLATQSLSQRLARILLELAQDYGKAQANGVLIDMPLTQADLASLIGASRESTNKNLGDFRGHGWIQIENGAITILDAAALRAEASR